MKSKSLLDSESFTKIFYEYLVNFSSLKLKKGFFFLTEIPVKLSSINKDSMSVNVLASKFRLIKALKSGHSTKGISLRIVEFLFRIALNIKN